MDRSRRSLIHAGAWALLSLGGCAHRPGPARDGAAPAAPSPAPPPPDAMAAGDGKKKILILGGTGFLGPKLVESATGRGHAVTLFNRGKTNPQLFPEVDKLRGDRDGDLKALEGRRWDAVIDTSGYVPRIVKASADLLARSVDQYVFISSISVFGDTSKPGIDESAPVATLPDPTSEDVPSHYGALKALCEQAAEVAMPGRVTNIRPGLISGPGDPTDRFSYWPLRVERGGEVLAPGTGDDPVQLIDVRDLAAWIVSMIEGRHVGVYNATGPEKELTMAAMLAACKAAAGSDASFVWAPVELLEEQKIEAWSDMPVWVPGVGESAGMTRINCAKAYGRGLALRPVEETARDTIAWWKTLPEARRAKLRAGLTPEREAEALAALKQRGRKTKAK